jgi:hypothetical protein
MGMKNRPAPLLFLSFVVILCCQAAKSPSEKVARQFMDHYYVETNLPLALEDTDGYAMEKIRKSVQLTEGQVLDASAHRPKITYNLLESRIGGDEADFLFQVVIEPKKMSPIRKKTLVKIRQRKEGEWKVTQFSDHDMGEE